MAATNYSPIQLYYSTTASAAPAAGNLVSGELAINITDGKLYYKDNAGAVQLLSTSTTANGTANGVLYLNGSKVATSGSALVFDGTNLGLGTSSPGSKLHLYTGAAATTLTIDSGTSGTAISYSLAGVSKYTAEYVSGSNFYAIGRSGVAYDFVLSGGNAGIGTSSPAGPLDVRAANAGGGGGIRLTSTTGTNGVNIKLNNSAGNLYFGIDTSAGGTFGNANAAVLWYDAAQSMVFATNNSKQMTLDSSGNLGLGVTPSAWSGYTAFDVARGSLFGAGSETYLSHNAYWNGSAWIRKATDFATNYRSNNGIHAWFTAASGTAGDAITFTQTMTLDSSGNLGLGVTPSNAYSGIKAFEFGANGTLMSESPSSVYNAIQLGVNFYYNAAGDLKYKSASVAASRYVQYQGQHQWYYAPVNSGSAGAALSFTQAMTLDASGNLGVGTTSPSGRLDLRSGGASTEVLQIFGRTSQDGLIGIAGATNGIVTGTAAGDMAVRSISNLFLGSNGGNSVIFYNNGTTERARIDSSGNLGLGVTPSAWASTFKVLQFKNGVYYGQYDGGSIPSGYFGTNNYYNGTNFIYVASEYATRYQQEQGKHMFYTAASGNAGDTITFTQAMTLDASGRLLLGMTSGANAALNLQQIGGVNATLFNTTNDAYTYLINNGSEFRIQNSYGVTAGQKPITFWASGSENARIDSSGNLLVGQTSTTSPGDGNTTAGTAIQSVGKAYFSCTTGRGLTLNRNEDGAVAGFFRSGTQVGSISVTTSATAYNTSSDYRLKDNQQPLTGSGAFIDALKPKTWNWKADGSRGVGFIAHEVQEVSPGSVVGEKDGEQMQAMEYGSAEFIANIIAELQSLRKRLADAGIA